MSKKIPKLESTSLNENELPSANMSLRCKRKDFCCSYMIEGYPEKSWKVFQHETGATDIYTESSFSLESEGILDSPNEWKNYHAELMLNPLNMPETNRFEKNGLIGDFNVNNEQERITIRLYLSHDRVRDILLQWRLFDIPEESDIYINFGIINLKKDQQNLIWGEIIRARFRSIPIINDK